MKTPRAVESLRIALGLGSHNEGKDLTIILTGNAPCLLAENIDDVADGEILEKHLPVFVDWGTVFSIAPNASVPSRYTPGIVTKPITHADLAGALEAADCALIFS